MEAEHDRACQLYKREFAKGLVGGKYWTPDQYKVKQLRDRTEFRLKLHNSMIARKERKRALIQDPEVSE